MWVLVAGLGLFLARGEAGLNVDFTKGTAYGGRLVDGQERALNRTPDGKLGLLEAGRRPGAPRRPAVADPDESDPTSIGSDYMPDSCHGPNSQTPTDSSRRDP